MNRYKIAFLIYLTQLLCTGQNGFNNYYKVGYNNVSSSNVLTTPDSGCVFVNYILDSLTGREDFGLIRLDKNGNELVKKSFNMFDLDYNRFGSALNQFIPATPCSYFITGVSFPMSGYTNIVLNKINRQTLDTISTKIYQDTAYSLNMSNFIKFNDNKYFLIGNKFNSTTSWPFILELDSNLHVFDTITVYNPNNFGITIARYNPTTKQILLGGINGIPGLGNHQPFTLMHIDTLGNPINAVNIPPFSSVTTAPFSYSYYILNLFYSAIDSSYVGVSGQDVYGYGGPGGSHMSRLFICKFKAATLQPVWQKTYGDEALVNGLGDAAILADGSIVACGGYSPLTSLPLMNEDSGGAIFKVDKNGNLQWFKKYDNYVTGIDPHDYWEGFQSIDTTLNGGFILCGTVTKPNAKAWAVKTNSLGCVVPGCPSESVTVQSFSGNSTYTLDVTRPTTVTAFAANTLHKESITVYPNPAREAVSINLNNVSGPTEVRITDLCGREIKRVSLRQNNRISLIELNSGIYFFSFFTKNGFLKTEKVIRE